MAQKSDLFKSWRAILAEFAWILGEDRFGELRQKFKSFAVVLIPIQAVVCVSVS